MTLLLEADCVSIRYGERTVLQSASLRARAGVVTALLGRNGIGKSSLLKVAAGVMAPWTGVVRMDGVAHERVRLSQLARRGVMYVPAFDTLHRSLSIETQLRGFASLASTPRPLQEVAQRLGVERVLSARLHQVSGGERRRVEIAAALLRRPRVLLIDEPLRSVSPIETDVILDALRELAALGSAVVITGHEFNTLAQKVDDITWCYSGTTREYATVSAARNDREFQINYLGGGIH